MAAFKPLGDQLDIFGALDAAESVSVLDSPVRDIPRPVLSKPVADTASVLRAEAEARSAVAAAGASSRVIEDAGEELVFNRRNRIKTGKRWNDISHLNDTLKVKEAVKGNIWPKPDYKALIEAGMQPMVAHVVKQIYDAVAVKPVVGRGVLDDAALQRYIGALDRVEKGVMAWAKDTAALKAWANANMRVAGAMLGRQVAVSELAGGSATLLDHVFPGGYKAYRDELLIAGGNKLLGALQPGYREISKASKALEKGWPEKREAWEVQGYRVVENPEVTVEPHFSKEGVFLLAVEDRFIKSFDSKADADAAAAKVGPFVLFNKRAMVDSFASEEEAVETAKKLAQRDKSGKVVGEKGVSVLEAERVGVNRRMEGEDVSAERVMAEFGLKGVNFGNWMKTPSARAEAQLHLNHAFDAFHDLAEILGVPPKAMGLNGMLGLAIGAQGHGGEHAAHFVAGVNEINLTRTCGAGALAHEWGHALDHYFAARGGLATEERPFLTAHATLGATRRVGGGVVDGKYVSHEVPRFGDLRPEMVAAFKAVVDTMDKREQTAAELHAGLDERLEKAKKSVNNWLKSIRRDFAGQEGAFDVLAERVRAGDVGDGKVAMGRDTMISPVVAEIRDLYKSKHGRVYSIDNIKGLQAWVDHVDYQSKRIESEEVHVPQKVSTDFAKNAAELDKAKGGKPYWSTPLEKFARAFDAYVSDELEARQAKNGYLSFTGRNDDTVPMGEDRRAVNSAFKALVGGIKTIETEKGVALASFAGENALSAEKYALANARELIHNGEDAESVRQETGWFQGVDKKWRFEINDSDAKLADGLAHKGYPVAPQASKLIAKLDRPLNLSDVLEHPALFAAYPALADYGVTFVPAKTISGSASISGKQILVSDVLPGMEVESALLHEIQHGIQRIEGFATGGSLLSAATVRDQIERLREASQNTPEFKQWAQAQDRLIESSLDDVALDAALKIHAEKYPGIQLPKIDIAASASEIYSRLAGEVEARNVQTRQKMSPEARRNLSPSETQDVSNADAIVVFNGKEVASLYAPANVRTEIQKSMSVPVIRMEIERLRETWKAMPPVTIVNTVADLPFKLASHADGAHCDGHVYVVASNIKDMKQLQKVMAHECVLHHSLQEMLGNYGFAKLNHGVQTLKAKGDPVVCELAGEIKRRYGALPAETETKEIVARAGEKCLDADGNIKVGFGFMKSVYAGAANWLRDKGFKIPFTNTELQGIMHDAGKWIEKDRVQGWQVGSGEVVLSSLDTVAPTKELIEKTAFFKWTKKTTPSMEYGGEMPSHVLLTTVPNKSAARVSDKFDMSVNTLPDGKFQLKYLASWGGNKNDFFAVSTDLTDLIVRSLSRLERSDKAIERSKDAAYKNSLIGRLEDKFGDAFSFAKSTQSKSEYIIHNPSGTKIRISDHALPLHYEQPDVDLRNHQSVDEMLREIETYLVGGQEKTVPAINSNFVGISTGETQERTVRADTSGSSELAQMVNAADCGRNIAPNISMSQEGGSLDDVVKTGSFTGRILDVLKGVVTQKKGLEGEVVRHDAAKLSAVPMVGALVKIQYGKDERGMVTDLSRKPESKARSRA